MGQNVTFISETGNDRVGEMILANMRENGVIRQCECLSGGKVAGVAGFSERTE